MFKINHIQNKELKQNYIELKNSNGLCSAKIELAFGASLQELILNNKQIIKREDSSKYLTSYTSSVLFPFVNRIKDGKYEFNNKKYQLEINLPSENNALHGLVYNKEFEIVEKNVTDSFAEVKLKYSETSQPKGFPFNYSFYLTYKLTATSLMVEAKAENIGVSDFPFSIGWHPYIYTSNLYDSYIKLDGDSRYFVNKNDIPNKENQIKISDRFQIKEHQFDDCFILNNNKFGFITPDYEIEFRFSSKNKYLQLYTPDSRNSLAIEPLTSPADSFNNKIDLQVLKPKETSTVHWTINLLN